MTKEDKEILLKDLCSRLPYETKIQLTEYSDLTGEKLPSKIKILDYCMLGKVQAYCKGFRKDEIKPYLFPLSSMTEEQYNEFFSYYHNIEMDEIKASGDYLKAAYLGENAKHDWLNKNHFDYRYLIDRNLAIDCTNLNIY